MTAGDSGSLVLTEFGGRAMTDGVESTLESTGASISITTAALFINQSGLHESVSIPVKGCLLPT
jgi:hypothetical protein